MSVTKMIAAAALAAAAVASLAVLMAASGDSGAPPTQAQARLEYASLPSAALGRELKFAVQLPPAYDSDKNRRYPVLFFLHGMFGNEGEFERRGVAAAVSRLREEGKIGDLIIVAPAGENSFYLNAKNGARFEDAILKDLIPHVEKTYRAVGTREGRAIQGISMGGFGALALAFKHPEMFSSVTAHSAALFTELPSTQGTDRRAQFLSRLVGNIFGNPPDEEFFRANNPLYLAETRAAALNKAGLKVYFDVGTEDRYGFQETNKLLNERLTKAGVTHEFHLFPGNHGWEYMISVAPNSYAFLWKHFNAAKPARAAK